MYSLVTLCVVDVLKKILVFVSSSEQIIKKNMLLYVRMRVPCLPLRADGSFAHCMGWDADLA